MQAAELTMVYVRHDITIIVPTRSFRSRSAGRARPCGVMRATGNCAPDRTVDGSRFAKALRRTRLLIALYLLRAGAAFIRARGVPAHRGCPIGEALSRDLRQLGRRLTAPHSCQSHRSA